MKTWPLVKYSRVVKSGAGGKDVNTASGMFDGESCSQKGKDDKGGNAVDVSGTTETLVLSLPDTNHLTIMHGAEIQENYSLWESRKWMKGFAKGDCIMLMVRTKHEHHRLCIKFAPEKSPGGKTCMQQCYNASDELAKFCSMTKIAVPGGGNTDSSSGADASAAIVQEPVAVDGTVSIATIAEILATDPLTRLPAAYQHTNIPSDQLELLVSLCLTDTNFPAFVGKVETVMNSLTATDKV